MQKTNPLLPVLLILLLALGFAGPNAGAAELQSIEPLPAKDAPEQTGVRQEYLAEQKIKMLPSKHGKTVDAYMNNMVRIPMAQDLGWQVSAVADGYEVERSILINNSKTLRYRWKVSDTGDVSPLNDGARNLMQ